MNDDEASRTVASANMIDEPRYLVRLSLIADILHGTAWDETAPQIQDILRGLDIKAPRQI